MNEHYSEVWNSLVTDGTGSHQVECHKRSSRVDRPLLSIVLVEPHCCPSGWAAQSLRTQSCSRDLFEVITVTTHNDANFEIRDDSDIVLSYAAPRPFHMHVGYNIGILASRAPIVTLSHGDTVFEPEFVETVLAQFASDRDREPLPIVLRHDEFYTRSTGYDLVGTGTAQFGPHDRYAADFNIGGCLSFRRDDALAIGGCDEQSAFRGRRGGTYELGWRLINSGITEIQSLPPAVTLRFTHEPPCDDAMRLFRPHPGDEESYDTVAMFAASAIRRFQVGAILPVKENAACYQIRMQERKIGEQFARNQIELEAGLRLLRTRWHYHRLRKVCRKGREAIGIMIGCAHKLRGRIRLRTRLKQLRARIGLRTRLRRLRARIGLRTRIRSLFSSSASSDQKPVATTWEAKSTSPVVGQTTKGDDRSISDSRAA